MVMTPERFVSNNTAERQLVEKVEESFKKSKAIGDWDGGDTVKILVTGEYTPQLRDKIAARYEKAGWAKVEHATSSEQGERPGLTVFVFHLGGA